MASPLESNRFSCVFRHSETHWKAYEPVRPTGNGVKTLHVQTSYDLRRNKSVNELLIHHIPVMIAFFMTLLMVSLLLLKVHFFFILMLLGDSPDHDISSHVIACLVQFMYE